jgi:enamine deaminase RidA (YjgF/YER057c/UK114 family)
MKMTLKPLLLIFYAVLSAAAFAQQPNELSNTHPVEAKPGASAFYSSEPMLDQGLPFSDAVYTAGNFVFLSGLVATGSDGALVDGGLIPETHAIFRQMRSHLSHFGLGLQDVVKCLVMIDNIDAWAEFNTVYTHYFEPPYPARSAFGADGLALGAALELEWTAVKL